MGYTNTIMTIVILILDGLKGTTAGPSYAFRFFELQIIALDLSK